MLRTFSSETAFLAMNVEGVRGENVLNRSPETELVTDYLTPEQRDVLRVLVNFEYRRNLW